ncbi:MAG: hypothetical protein U0T81_18470 [Saprospiraceae bacterium]
MDELLTNWRYRHAQMVMRMLGENQVLVVPLDMITSWRPSRNIRSL